MINNIRKLMAITAISLFAGTVFAQGVLVPTERHLPMPPEHGRPEIYRPFTVKLQKAEVKITDGVAETTVEQVFHNETSTQQEAIYLFPVPENAAITRMTMTVGDKIVEAKLLPASEARAIYQDTVRRLRDPALLELAGKGLIKLSVFPIPPGGDQKITVRYAETLKQENGALRYVYPMRVAPVGQKPIETLSLLVNIESSLPLYTVYSPSHADASCRIKDEKTASVSWEASNIVPDRDFTLYIRAGKDDIGMSLLTYRQGNDGYFLLFLSPSAKQKQVELPKSVVLVLDRTGSMSGEKIQQAKAALIYVAQHLKPKDNFNVIYYNEEPTAVFTDMVAATDENIKKAVDTIQSLEAEGGTNIKAALSMALDQFKSTDSETLQAVLFLTDGLPTVGETDVNRILAHVNDNNKSKVRFFNWGVGWDVNVPFLDKLSQDNRGESDYVRPNENIEVKVSAYYDKISSPILTDLKLFFEGVEAKDIYPKSLPDLFKGGMLTIAGRYNGNGKGAVVLEGLSRKDTKKFQLAANWPEQSTTNDYLPRLWATRKIGYLLDQNRLQHNQEVVDEIVRLAREYGIVTEYTSFLIDEQQIMALREGKPDQTGGVETFNYNFDADEESGVRAQTQSRLARDMNNAAAVAAPGAQQGAGYSSMGKVAGESKDEWVINEADKVVQRVQYVGDKTFYFDGKQWIDSRNDVKFKQYTIKRFSDAHFALIDKLNTIGEYSAIGDNVLVIIGTNAVIISDEGQETLSSDELKTIIVE